MNILHVFSANIYTGAVEHALDLAEWQQAAGHRVVLASDYLTAPRGMAHYNVPIHNRKWAQRRKNAVAIRRIVAENDIQIIHAHSRAASAAANRALRGKDTALVSTVHGRQHIHFKSKNFNVYGEKIIAVSEDLKSHLVDELNKRPGQVTVLPNGIRFDTEPTEQIPEPMTLALIGRLSGPKGERAAMLFRDVFPELLRRLPELLITIVGDVAPPLPADGHKHLAALQNEFGKRITATGFLPDILPAIKAHELIVGAGRVALRALGEGRSVAALGEATFGGLVDEENVNVLASGNFGDTGVPQDVDPAVVLTELETFFTRKAANRRPQDTVIRYVRKEYSLDAVAPYVMGVYREARMRCIQPRWLPVLMYHKIPDAALDSPHRIFVTPENFEKHLSWTASRGLTPVTFSDYEAVARGERPASQWPSKPVVFTFDDGYESVLRNALPLMQARGWRGGMYLLGDPAITENFWDTEESAHSESRIMSHEAAKQLVRAGWDIGAHTMRHPHLDGLGADEIAYEINESKRRLEEALGVPVRSFAYPFGSYNNAVVSAVADAGFETAVATDTGGLLLEDDRFRIFRVNIFPEESRFSHWKKTSSWYRRYYFRKRGR